MGNYTNLLATVNAQIRANGNHEITGPVLNAVLKNLISVLGDGYRFKGVAVPDDNPGTPDNRVFYIAGSPGTYANFGGLVVPDDSAAYILTFDTVWAAAQLPAATTASVQAVMAALADKVDKEEGKVLSTNDFTDTDKALLDSLQGGAFPGLFAGFTANLIDTRSNGVAQSFAFRKSGGDGVNYLKRIKGKTLVWNQMVDNGTTEVTTISGRKYLTRISGVDAIVTSTGASIAISESSADNVFDLTLMFGSGNEPSSVDEFRALFPLLYYDYNAGALINNAATDLESTGFNQWDEEWENGTFNYSTGTPTPRATAIRSKNFTRIEPSTAYYFKVPGSNTLRILWYDANKAFISALTNLGYNNTTQTSPANAAYLKIGLADGYGTSYNHDICINLSDPDRNGTYEPYWKATRHLGLDSFEVTDGENTITVEGLKSAGSVYDEITEGKKYIKRVETRAYQSGDESNSAVTTDGTNTNYALATPVEYDLVNPITPYIEVDEDGTERRLPEDTAAAPQAPFESDSNYSVSIANLTRKLAAL